ncbi:hypothetical protein ACSBR2_035731 [Camellia fascicularis]
MVTAGPCYAPEDPNLPKPWKGLVDGKTVSLYFWNPETNVTQYEKPAASSHTGSAPPQKLSSAPVSSSVQVEQSSHGHCDSIFNDDDDRYNGGSNSGSKLDTGTQSYQLIADKMPELLDFDKDLVHLEAASKIQLKSLAEEIQAASKGLEKVEQELTASEKDGAISAGFQKGRSADSLSQYFGDPARCPFEQGLVLFSTFMYLIFCCCQVGKFTTFLFYLICHMDYVRDVSVCRLH